MPGLSGLELHEALIARGVRIPVIMITGQGDVPTAVRAMKAGVAEFIEKPVDQNELLGMVRRLLAEQHEAGRVEKIVADVVEGIGRLNPHEREALKHLVAGASHKVIAQDLGISQRRAARKGVMGGKGERER